MDILNIRATMRTTSIYDIPLRVTFYARVSSDSDEQLNSLDNQVSYYESFIKKNPAWTFVPGYVDEGLSGISTKKRKHFKKMRPVRTARFERSNRIVKGHKTTVRYGYCLIV